MHENVKVSVKVDAPVEQVWNALTQKDLMRNWYFDISDFDLAVGNAFNFYEPGEERKYHHHCEILEVVAQEKLKHSWTYPDISKEKTIVKWELDKEGEGTVVTLTHKGLENFHHLGEDFYPEKFQKSWEEILGVTLKNYLEK